MKYIAFSILALAILAQDIAQETETVRDPNQLPPITEIQTILSFLVLGIIVGLCQAGGIGGGPIISPLMMAMFGVGSRKAVWNTYVMLLGGSFGNFLRLGKERTKSGSSPLINYKLVLLTLPLLLAGAVIGVATGKWVSKIFIAIFLFAILLQVLYKTHKSYKRLRDQENLNPLNQPILVQEIEMTSARALPSTSNQTEKDLKIIQEKEKELYPLDIIKQQILQVAIVIAITLIKGSNLFPSFLGIPYCSLTYHFFNLLIFIIALFSVYKYREQVQAEEAEKERVNYDFSDGRMSSAMDQTVIASLFAGFLGGLVGLGGGVILTPLWLEMGIQSQRAAASATFCVLFTAFISFFQVLIIGGYRFDEFLILFIVSACGSYIVAGQLKALVARYKRESIIVQVLLGVITFGLIILPIQAIKEIRADPEKSMKFGRFC